MVPSCTIFSLMLHFPSLSPVLFAFSFTVVCAIVSITPTLSFTLQVWFEALLKFKFLVCALGVTGSHLGAIGSRFGCHWFMFSIRILGAIGSRFRFTFQVSLVHMSGSRLGAIGLLFDLTLTSTSCVVLPHFSLLSLFVWFHSLVLVDFIWVHLCSLVLLSPCTRGMFSVSLKCCIICMFGLFYVCLYHKFWVSKILGRKNFK